MRSAFGESTLILLLAAFLGFSYTAITGKGFFAREGINAKATTNNLSGFPQPQIIELVEAEQLFRSGGSIIVDTRHPFDYSRGHITGAINIPLGDFEQHISFFNKLNLDTLIITYCDGAQCSSSMEFAAKLTMKGFRNVKIFFGGWMEWKAKNLPTEGTEP